QSIEALKEVPIAQLQWMIDNSRHYPLPEGQYLFRPGEPAAGTHIIVEGRIRLYVVLNNELREISMLTPKDISGYLPFSRGLKASVNGKVISDALIMTLPTEKFREMISHHFELTQALVQVMTTRVRDFTSLQQQNEKMMALGKLSAGLAHELNNPAAAIVRGSTTLKQHLQLEPVTFKEIMAIRMGESGVDRVSEKLFEILGRKEKPKLTLMERTEHEDEIRDCLEEHGVEHADELAE